MLQKLLQSRNERKLGEAIAAHDLRTMETFLAKGVRRVDYMLMRPADFGNGSEKIPAGKFVDAVSLAKTVGMQKPGMDLLARYGLGEPGPTVAPARPRQ